MQKSFKHAQPRGVGLRLINIALGTKSQKGAPRLPTTTRRWHT